MKIVPRVIVGYYSLTRIEILTIFHEVLVQGEEEGRGIAELPRLDFERGNANLMPRGTNQCWSLAAYHHSSMAYGVFAVVTR